MHGALRLLAAVTMAVVVSLAVGLVGPPRAGATEPLVANGDFESGPPGGVAPGWTTCYGPASQVSVVAARGVAGSQALRLVDPDRASAAGVCSDRFAVTPGEAYNVAARVSGGAASVIVYLYFHDGSGAQLSQHNQVVPVTPAVWQVASLTETAPVGAVSASVLLYSSGWMISDTWWDRISVAGAGRPWQEIPVAMPVRQLLSLSSAFGTGPDGHPRAYLPKTGAQAELSVVDLVTGGVQELALPGAEGAWGTTVAPDGRVYIASYPKGHLYRYTNGGAVEDLGRPLASETFVWKVAVAADGMVYGGTYPGGKVFRYDPGTGQVRDYGQVLTGAQYARSITIGSDGYVYVALGTTRAAVVRLDPVTGDRTELPLPTPYSGEKMIYDLDWRGDTLFARAEQSSTLLAYRQGAWSVVGPSTGLLVSPVDPGAPSNVYYVRSGDYRLMRYNLTTQVVTDTGKGAPSARGLGWGVLPNADGTPTTQLLVGSSSGTVWVYDPATGGARMIPLGVRPVPTIISEFGFGPDGRLYASGMQSGGLSAVDPVSGSVQEYPSGVGQVEHFLPTNGKLYLGTYPKSTLYEFDPGQPFAMGVNPKPYLAVASPRRDRPVAAVRIGTTLAVGHVPGYGELGGELTLVDLPALTTTSLVPVPAQSVVSLTAAGGWVVGATSVYGGLGVTPTAQSAELFLVDPTTRQVVWHGVPLPGERAITAVRAAPDGTVWGVTLGKVFQFDPATRQVLTVVTIEDVDWSQFVSVWNAGGIEISGTALYVLARGAVHRIDTTTMNRQVVATTADGVRLAADGTVLITRRAEIIRIGPG